MKNTKEKNPSDDIRKCSTGNRSSRRKTSPILQRRNMKKIVFASVLLLLPIVHIAWAADTTDTQGPVVTIKSPKSGQKITAPTVVVSGTASDALKGKNGIVSVTVNGERANNDTAAGSGTASWSKTIPLSTPGANSIVVVARDSVGNETTKTFSINYATSPVLVVKSPANNSSTASARITVKGTATDKKTGNSGIVSVTVNGERAANDTTTGTVTTASWSKSVDLLLGSNIINVVAADGLGYTTTKSLTITRIPDTKGPKLTLKTPNNGQKITGYSLTISGTASDASMGGNGIASVTVNGARTSGDTAEGNAIARWSITLDAPTKTITVVATDTQGQSTQKTITVKLAHLGICDANPIILDAPPGAKQSRGCIVNYTQTITDPAYIEQFGTDTVERRYLVYAPKNLPQTPVPVVFMFPGKGTNAESAAYYMAQTRFETLADRDGFVVVYGNGLPFVRNGETQDGWMESGGDFLGCFLEHSGEGIDVQYVREILDQLETELNIDRTRVYATGISAGGGLSFQLAMEAPDLVAAVAPVAGLPFQPAGTWLFNCNVHPDNGTVPMAMLAATADYFISYQPGGSAQYPDAQYPGMEETRDVWLSAMGITGAPTFVSFPDTVKTDSYQPQSGVKDSYVELYKYPSGTLGAEFWYYKAVGAGHWWPNPTQMYYTLWATYGKTNQDIDFADQAWAFFQRHSKQ